jgi:hypothetical protein
MNIPTKEKFQQLLAAHPGLCDGGYCHGRCEGHEEDRQRLAKSYGDFRLAYVWLRTIPRVKRKRYTSYAWKHVFERHTGRYITNGAFIAAALAAQVPCEIPQAPARGYRLNVPLGLSVRYMRQCDGQQPQRRLPIRELVHD